MPGSTNLQSFTFMKHALASWLVRDPSVYGPLLVDRIVGIYGSYQTTKNFMFAASSGAIAGFDIGLGTYSPVAVPSAAFSIGALGTYKPAASNSARRPIVVGLNTTTGGVNCIARSTVDNALAPAWSVRVTTACSLFCYADNDMEGAQTTPNYNYIMCAGGAAGANACIFRSADFGVTWTSIALPAAAAGQVIQSIAGARNTWVATMPGTAVPGFVSTDNGLTWTQIAGTAAPTQGFVARCGPPQQPFFLSTAVSGNMTYSFDGISWNEIATAGLVIAGLSRAGLNIALIEVAGFQRSIFYATDPTVWTRIYPPVQATNGNIVGLYYNDIFPWSRPTTAYMQLTAFGNAAGGTPILVDSLIHPNPQVIP